MYRSNFTRRYPNRQIDCAYVAQVTLSSTTLRVHAILAFVQDCVRRKKASTKGVLGTSLWVFQQYLPQHGMHMRGRMEFSRRKLKSTRTLANVFLVADVERALVTRLTFFETRQDWYQLNGVPHTLGIMLHGPPGSGKTSTIKAIANKCKRHIVTVNLSCIASKDELYDIFTTDTVSDVGGQSVELPINRRLFVIEDIDCMLSVVLQRQFGQEKINETKEKKEEKTFTLSDLLNVLDGLSTRPAAA
ncbi:Mitochondrial chaperone BCS1 [Tetrabaena socialis]|uniref:Mitochondrial chaperone BCS1 n=1 Tax=Tetrabaena socialis TaxID=47790 RepID=A0A2J7ZR40_9CHLO|nr:Mitochondrial chaperone BCS1 [Tetrabaena socialis]|eukprot:PNH02716.1 Mitochondrial chaperone BCS1 [Tetrabaena socialis]